MGLAAELGVAAWPAAMIVWGPGFTSTAHRHPSMQLIMTLRGSLRIRSGPHGAGWKRCAAALVRSNAVHEVDARGRTVVLAYIHPESELGAALAEGLAGDIACVSAAVVARWRGALKPVSGTTVEGWVAHHLLNGQRPVRIDARIRRVLLHIRKAIGTSDDFSLHALAARAGLSPSRFLHLFKQTLGVPLRPYLRWLRLQRGACELIDGARVSTAAHRAGFADAAHLSRTFRRMLGMTPSDIARHVRTSRAISLL